MKTPIERARAYLSRLPVSVAGQGGHAASFNAAAVLTVGFELSEADAWPLLAAWNARCLPPWTDGDLRHKLRSASTASQRPLGYLLQESEPQRQQIAPVARREIPVEVLPPWPTFSRLSPVNVETIASLRKLPTEAVAICARAGFIGSGIVKGYRSFVIGEGRFAQARRLEGKPFKLRDESTPKSFNLPGSQGAFIGQRWLGESPPILLVEGCISLLEATAAVLLADAFDWTVLAATSASSRFTRDPELLARMKGRRVRIIPDADDAGLDGAAEWLDALESAGATVDAYPLPSGYKDLGEMIADPSEHTALQSIFKL